jgi:hypothetical protein
LIDEHEEELAKLAATSSTVASLICVYDGSVVAPSTILAAIAAHPHVVGPRLQRDLAASPAVTTGR